MAKVLAVLTSARTKGFTAQLLEAAVEGACEVPGVSVDRVDFHRYKVRPCTSCFNCIRDPEHLCNLDDDFGRNGEGELFRKVKEANGLMLADPVHFWGATAGAHLFVERCYPFVWTQRLRGMPVITISCASNQGFMREATRELCRWCFTLALNYLGGVPAHTAYFPDALKDARYLGRKLAEAAKRDAEQGRKAFSEEEWFRHYENAPWSVLENYMDNLSLGTFTWEGSMIEIGLRRGTFRRAEALRALEKAREHFQEAVRLFRMKNSEQLVRELSKASAYWTEATWLEFLERDVIRAEKPKAYRPVEEG